MSRMRCSAPHRLRSGLARQLPCAICVSPHYQGGSSDRFIDPERKTSRVQKRWPNYPAQMCSTTFIYHRGKLAQDGTMTTPPPAYGTHNEAQMSAPKVLNCEHTRLSADEAEVGNVTRDNTFSYTTRPISATAVRSCFGCLHLCCSASLQVYFITKAMFALDPAIFFTGFSAAAALLCYSLGDRETDLLLRNTHCSWVQTAP